MSERKALRDHQMQWLSVHPARTEAWLRDRLRDGFDVHHVDGDRTNNDPANLVLIECADHLMLHNGHRKMLRMGKAEKLKAREPKKKKANRFGVSAEQIERWRAAPRYTAFILTELAALRDGG